MRYLQESISPFCLLEELIFPKDMRPVPHEAACKLEEITEVIYYSELS